jgi:hypothetical protein
VVNQEYDIARGMVVCRNASSACFREVVVVEKVRAEIGVEGVRVAGLPLVG